MRRLSILRVAALTLIFLAAIGVSATASFAASNRGSDQQITAVPIPCPPPIVPLPAVPVPSAGAAPHIAPLPCGTIYPPPLPPPQFPNAVVIRSYKVNATIIDQIAVTQIDLDFVNHGERPAEGSNLIPLPPGAAVSNLTMTIDGQTMQGQILDANQARAIYEETVRRLRDPALLQYVGQAAIQVNVFPIPPGQDRALHIAYSQVLPAENNLVAYEFPLRAGYLSQAPVQQMSVAVSVTSSKDAISTAYSPDPLVLVTRPDDHHIQAGFETGNYLPTDNFRLYYGFASGTVSANLITYRASADEDGYFMLMLAPPFMVDPSQVIPKDVILVLDQSGSMQGQKWSQAQGAAEFVLKHLNANDRFNVIVFSTGYRIFAKSLQSIDQAGSAAAWVQTQQAEGGTDINGALLEALSMTDPSRQTTVLFMTDGQPTEGVTDLNGILKNVQDKAPANVRIFTFGVGDDVNTYLLDSLSTDFHGTSVYVHPNEDLEAKISGLYAKISAPVLTALKLNFGNVTVEDMYPADPLPDLFAGQELIVAGRFRDQGTTTLTLTGARNDQIQTFTFPNLTFPANASGQPFVARLWATRKIGVLLQNIQLHGQTQELVDEIVRLSVRYGIITPYTSYLIQENGPTVQNGSGAATAVPAIAAAPSAQTGRAAVDAAGQANGMAGAAAPAQPAPGNSGSSGGTLPIRQVADRAFVLRNGVWTDTQYVPGTAGTPVPMVTIKFASDDYFAFAAAHPELADALALGDQVIIVVNGTVYQIVP